MSTIVLKRTGKFPATYSCPREFVPTEFEGRIDLTTWQATVDAYAALKGREDELVAKGINVFELGSTVVNIQEAQRDYPRLVAEQAMIYEPQGIQVMIEREWMVVNRRQAEAHDKLPQRKSLPVGLKFQVGPMPTNAIVELKPGVGIELLSHARSLEDYKIVPSRDSVPPLMQARNVPLSTWQQTHDKEVAIYQRDLESAEPMHWYMDNSMYCPCLLCCVCCLMCQGLCCGRAKAKEQEWENLVQEEASIYKQYSIQIGTTKHLYGEVREFYTVGLKFDLGPISELNK